MSFAPLSGYRVLDLTNVLSGPFCCHQLVHMGAEVIKVERPKSGDLARQLGADPALNAKKMGISFLAQNPGKKSFELDFKSDEDKILFKKLVKTADVVVENFRPGVMDRLGLGYDHLKALNPRLIYCAISGFGQDGRLKNNPAYDQIIQGYSGIMSITGQGEETYRVGYPVCDTIGGMTAAFAISSALAQRGTEREGCFIDVSMLEASIATMGWVVSNYLIAGKVPQALGNDNFTASPSGTFQTKDFPINIAANKQEQFEAICDQIGREDLKTDPRYAQRQDRLTHRATLQIELEAILKTQPADHWLECFTQAGVPCGPVHTVPQTLNHPQIKQRDLIQHFDHVNGLDHPIDVLKTGFKINGETPSVDSPPPVLGSHNAEILAELATIDLEDTPS